MPNERPNLAALLVIAALISSVLIAPFVLLELRYGSHNYSSFPYPLFVMLWLLPMGFVMTIAPIVRSLRTGRSALAHPVTLALRVICLAVFAVLWIGVVQDQMPCFLGVPNCD